jgi:DnaK suppressor protein
MDELTDAQLRELTERLSTLKRELEQSLEAGAESAKQVELDQSAVGRLSRIDAIQQQKMAEAARRNVRVRVSQCAAALEAVTRGEYGFCRACEEPIGYRRMDARPESPLCVGCQAQLGR